MLGALALLAFAVSAGAAIAAPGGFSGDPSDAAAAANASFAPLNARMYRMVQPDGEVRDLAVDEDAPGALFGDPPWIGSVDGAMAMVRTSPESDMEPTGFRFRHGLLVGMLLGGREYRYKGAKSAHAPTRTLASLWPEGERRKFATPPDAWATSGRLRLWYRNPNVAGFFFVELALVGAALVLRRKLLLRVSGAVLFAAASVCLVKTGSRAALVALAAGAGAMAAMWMKGLFSWKRLAILAGVLALAAGLVLSFQSGGRFTKHLVSEGYSDVSRLPIWKEVPRMVADAPGGWGWGGSGRAYVDWYQKKSTCIMHDLVGSHCTVMAEAGWCGRFLYVFAWIFVLWTAFTQACRGRGMFPLGVFAAFAVGAVFHPVVFAPTLWIVPAVACAMMFAARERPVRCHGAAAASAAISASVCLGVFAIGCLGDSGDFPGIRRRGNAVTVGGRFAQTCVVDDDWVLHGGYWWIPGKAIRDHYAEHPGTPAMTFVRDLGSIPRETRRLVLTGTAGAEFLKDAEGTRARLPALEEVVFLSPPFAATRVPSAGCDGLKVKVVQGRLALRLAGADGDGAPEGVEIVPDAELYVPDWMERIAKGL